MSKKRVLAGIMSLLLLITSVFTGNVVTARADEVTEYNDFNPDVTNNLYMVELRNCNATCGSVSFGTTVVDSKVNPGDMNESKSRFEGSTVIISFTPIEGEFVDRIQIGSTEYRPGDGNCVLPENLVVGEDEVFTFTTQASDFDENGYLRIEVGFTGGGDNEYNDFNPDVSNNLYMVELRNCNATCGSVSFGTTVVDSKVNPGDVNESKSRFQGSTVIISFTPIEGEHVDRILIGSTEYRPGDENFVQPSNMSQDGETFTYTTQASDFDENGYLRIEVGFTGGGGGVNSYGKDGRLAFKISNSDKGNVFFQIEGDKYRVGGDDQYSESTIIDRLKDKEFAATETITVWAENGEGVNVSHFDILINGASPFDDTAKNEAKNAAQGNSGYLFTVPNDYTSDKLIEFQIEFSDGSSGDGGGNDVTYTESTTISEETIKQDITVSAGTLTIDGCSVRVDHKLVVESGATIVGTTASSKLVFAGGAFSNGIALYYQDGKISDDSNNYYSNNGDGPVEFIWDTTSRRWVTQQEPAEGGGDALWYTVSYGNSANLTTKNGKVYAERVHVGDKTYSSIESEYSASETDEIYSMADTIFHQKTQEEENDPNYVDSLTRYGIGGSDGDIFIRSDVSGVSIDFKFIPDFGYQLTNIYTNENETESLLNDFTAAEAVSSFKFEAKQGKNVHFEVKFEKVDNKVTGNAGVASSAKIESSNAAASGTLEMSVNNATASDAIPSGSEALAAYDITLTNVVSKGGDRGSWNTPLEDLGGNVATVTLPVENADTANYTYTVIREHGGEQPATLDATVTNGTITFDTNKFSTYTIVKKPIIRSVENAEITLGDALTYNGATQTQTIASVKVDGRTLTAGTDYEVSGNTGTNANTYTLTITGQGNYTGTATKDWSIGKKSITGATITLGATLTYDGTTQTQTISSVVIGDKTLTASDYTISGNEQKDAGTYTLTVEGTGNYTGTATKQFTIEKATLTPALSGTTAKVYDNTTAVTATNDLTLSVTGLKNSETVTVTAAAYAYDNANAGTGKTITATGITISGDAAKNYVLSVDTATVANGEITQATPTITLSNLSETTQAPTGAKATLTPADASAAVVVEYKVVDTPAVVATPGVPCNVTHEDTCASKQEGNTIEDCNCRVKTHIHDEECGYKAATEGTPATYKWVTTRPTTPGTYEVHAYLPIGNANVAAIPEANAVTGSYTLTQYTAPAGDNTSNNTGSSSSSGSTTTTPTTPAVTTPEAPAATDTTTTKPATKKPVAQTEETVAGTTTGVTSEDGSSGWTDIENEISDKLEAALEAAGEGETETVEVVVEMNGEKKIPTDIFEAIKGQNIEVTFEMGDGIAWTVNGMDVTADKFENISFGASTGSGVTAIPTELIAGIAGENFGMELTLEYEGEFGFTAVMTVNVDKKNAGKYANLFYFNPKTETMEFICSAPVKEDGTTDLTFTHASDYVIVVSDATMSEADNTSLEDVQGAESGDTSDEPATGEVTTDKKAWTPIWIIVIGAFIIIIGGIVLFAVKKKND